MAKSNQKQPTLSPLENDVMQIVWTGQPITAEKVRSRMEKTHGLKESTIRTLLRRLEVKGYVTHDVEGRTYIYRATLAQTKVASSSVRSIVDKFCSGSVENLLVGLVDDKLISSERLQKLANRIATTEEKQAKKKKPKRRKHG